MTGFGDYDYVDDQEKAQQQANKLPGLGGPDDFGAADVEGKTFGLKQG